MVKKYTPRKVDNSIRDRARQIPLDIRLFVEFEFEWYNMFVPDRGHTEDEEKRAHKWAKMMVKKVLKINKQYIQDMLH